MATILPNGRNQFFDLNGNPLVGGLLDTWNPGPGITTPKTTWFDAAGSSAHANPIVLDARGEATIFWSGGYNVRLRDSAGNLIYLVESINTDLSPADVLAELADTSSTALGDALIGVKRNSAGAAGQTLHAWIEEQLPTPFDFGAVGDGTTIDNAAFAAWATAIAGKAGRIPVPSASYKLTTGILFAANTAIVGDDKYSAIIDWYGADACFRCVGTVNVSGSNKQVWSGFTIRCKGNGSPQDCMALLWGGINVVEEVRLTWDGVNRPRYCIVADQLALLQIIRCDLEAYSGFGVIGPNTGEYTTYGVSSSSFVTAAKLSGCQFNSTFAGSFAVAFDIGEDIQIGDACNFNASPTAIRLGNVTAFQISNNYFERTVTDYNASTNHGPALLCSNTSSVAGAALTVTNRTEGTFGPGNHVEMYQNNVGDSPSDNDGIVEVAGGFAGTLALTGNQFAQPRSHCCYVISGTATKIVFDTSNYFLNGGARNGTTMDVYVDPAATASIDRTDARRHQLTAAIQSIEWGGHKLFYAAAIPTSSAGSALEGETVAAGDFIFISDGSCLLQVQTGGTFGDDQSSNCSTTNGSRDVILSGSDGTIIEGSQITIAGVTGTKTVKQVYVSAVDGLRHITVDTTCDSTGSGRAITFAVPALGPKITGWLRGSTTFDPPSLADGAGTTTTVTVTGAALGDYAVPSFSLDLQGITVTAYVSSANTVSVRFQNESGGVLDLGSGTLRAAVMKA